MKSLEIYGIIFLCLLTCIRFSKSQETAPVKCSLEDSKCLTREAQKTLQKFIDGIPELGIKSLEKLPLEPIRAQVGNFSFEWDHMTAVGLRDAIIDTVSIDMNFKSMRVFFRTNLTLDIYYNARGLVFDTITVFGKGDGEITLKQLQMEIFFVFDIIKGKDGKDYMELQKYFYGYDTVDGVNYYFDNLFHGNKTRSDAYLKLLNENWRTVLAGFGGFFNRKITDKIFDAVKIYMLSRPLEDFALYP